MCTNLLLAQSYSGGSGTSVDPCRIANKTDLIYLSEHSADWTKYFTQTTDISFAAADFQSGGVCYNSGGGFIPIGNSSVSFSGQYEGNGHTISNLQITRSTTDDIGLFGYTDGAVIKNFGLLSCNITGQQETGGIVGYNNYVSNVSTVDSCYVTGSVSGSSFVGALVGRNVNCTIEHSHSSGTVTGTGTYVGGLVGYSIDNSYYIEYCYSTASVSSSSGYVGGLVGQIYKSAVYYCYSSGDVSGAGDAIGGLVGQNAVSSTISNCYSLGNVTRSSGTSTEVGGFCGIVDNSTIEYSYSTGSVYYTGTSAPTDKAFVGVLNNSATWISNFWDTGVSNQTSDAVGAATGESTANMKTNSTFTDAGWSTSTWYRDSGINNGYPYLSWQNTSGTPLPVELSSFAAKQVNGNVELNWQTATEVNCYGFNIERANVISTEGRNLNWEKVGFIKGGGNSNSPKSYSFIDDNPLSGDMEYRLKQIDNNGQFVYSKTVEVTTLPTQFKLAQNYPNPFNPTTTIQYAIPKAEHVTLKVYDELGKEVKTLVDENKAAGQYNVQFSSIGGSASGGNGSGLASGIYICRLQAGKYTSVKKMILLK